MCRYAFRNYKSHFACFTCQKTFKRRNLYDIVENPKDFEAKEAKCPDCATLMADMGLDFEAPKKKDDKAWRHLKTLYSVGITFHSCGCSGPGYIPKNHADLVLFYKDKIANYETELKFWRKREQPQNQSEKDKEYNKFAERINKLWNVERNKLGIYETESAIQYWINAIQKVQGKLSILSKT